MAERRNILITLLTRTAVSLVLIAIAVGLFSLMFITRQQPGAAQIVGTPPNVLVIRVHPVPVQRRYEGFGTARSMDAADVPARVTSSVISIPGAIEPGQFVDRGEILMRLDDADFRHEREVATETIAELDAQLGRLDVEENAWKSRLLLVQDDVRLAETEYQRVVDAMARDAAKQRELDQARQAVIAAMRTEIAAEEELGKIPARRLGVLALKRAQEAHRKDADLDLERSTISSPIEGVIQTVDVELGESVMPGQRVARVVGLRHIETPLRLSASSRSEIAVGDVVELVSSGSSQSQWVGAIARVSPEDDPSTRTLAVFVEISQDADDANMLAPGRFIRGSVQSSRVQMRTVVPRRALRADRIKIIVDGQVTSIPVEVDFRVFNTYGEFGVDDRQWAVLKTALPEGTLVIADGSVTAADGKAVTPSVPAGADMASSNGRPHGTGVSQ